MAKTVDTWWFVSVVHKDTGMIIRRNADAVQAATWSKAIESANGRNPRKPHEQFGVMQAPRSRVNECIEINVARTKEIAELIETIETRLQPD